MEWDHIHFRVSFLFAASFQWKDTQRAKYMAEVYKFLFQTYHNPSY